MFVWNSPVGSSDSDLILQLAASNQQHRQQQQIQIISSSNKSNTRFGNKKYYSIGYYKFIFILTKEAYVFKTYKPFIILFSLFVLLFFR